MSTPSLVSISEAARRAGVSRITMHRAISKGAISKEIGNDGKPAIRLSELARAYPNADVAPDGGKIQAQQPVAATETLSQRHLDTGTGAGGLQAQIALLQEALTDARQQRDKAQEALEQERQERLKQAERLDAVLEVQTRLLTDQRPGKKGFWQFGRS